MDCVYCQLGGGAGTTARRRPLAPERAVLAEIRTALESGTRIEAITFSGSGEPTLHSGLGRIIRGVKRMTRVPVVVLTNSSTLTRPDVRKALAAADIVVPSLDAATEGVFRKINRPHPTLTAAKIIAGLIEFRRVFRGRIQLEILFVKGVNDRPGHLRALRRAIALIRPDRVQLNTVVRPPAERTARPISEAALKRIKHFLGGETEIIAAFPEKRQTTGTLDLARRVRDVVERRPETPDGIARSLGVTVVEIRRAAEGLEAAGLIKEVGHDGRIYYESGKAGSDADAGDVGD